MCRDLSFEKRKKSLYKFDLYFCLHMCLICLSRRTCWIGQRELSNRHSRPPGSLEEGVDLGSNCYFKVWEFVILLCLPRLTPGQVTHKPRSGHPQASLRCPTESSSNSAERTWGPRAEQLQRELEKERTAKRELSCQLRDQEDFNRRCIALLRESRELQERQQVVAGQGGRTPPEVQNWLRSRTMKRGLSSQLRAQEDFHRRCVALLRESKELQERQQAVLARAEGTLEGPLQEVQNRPRSRKYRGRSGSWCRRN